MEGKKAQNKLLRLLWHQRKRITAFVLAFTMTFINVVNNVSVALAAVGQGEQQIFSSDAVIFNLDAEELVELAKTAAVQASESDASKTFEFKGDSDLIAKYNSLFGNGIVEVNPSYDSNIDDITLRVFVKDKEKVIFLFMNDTEDYYECAVNISGYMTDSVFVDAYSSVAVEEAPTAPGPETNLPVGGNGSTGGGSGSSTQPNEPVDTDTVIDVPNQQPEDSEDVNNGDIADENIGTEIPSDSVDSSDPESDAADENNSGADVSDEGISTDDSNSENDAEDDGITSDGNSDENSVSEDEATADEDNSGDDMFDEGASSDSSDSGNDASDDGNDVSDEENSSDNSDSGNDVSDEGASSDDSSSDDSLDAGTQASIISKYAPRVTTSVEASDEADDTIIDNSIPEDSIIDNTVTDKTSDGIIENAEDEVISDEDGIIGDDDIIGDDEIDTDAGENYGVIDSAVYDTVGLDGLGVAAIVVAVSDLEQIEVQEENVITYYQVTYDVDEENAVIISGLRKVEAGKNLSFRVRPQAGYAIESVNVNGEDLEASDDYWYQIESVSQDLQVDIATSEITSHPEFTPEPITIGDVVISVYAKPGVIPEGAVFVAEAVTEQEQAEITDKVIEEAEKNSEEVVEVLSYNIDLLYEGEKLTWNEGTVEVMFSGSKIEEKAAEADIVDIVHVDTDESDELELNTVATEDVSGETPVEMVSFEAEHFSTYTVTFKKSSGSDYKINIVQLDENGKEISKDTKKLTIKEGDFESSVDEWYDVYRYISDDKIAEKISIDGYVYSKATTKSDIKNSGDKIEWLRVQNKKAYYTKEDNKDASWWNWNELNEEQTIYFWYETKNTVRLNHRYNNSTLAGKISVYTDTEEISVKELAGVNDNGYTFTRATLQASDSSNSTEVKRLRKGGENYQYSTEDNGDFWVNFIGTPTVYFWYTQTVTVSFNPNGGSGEKFSLQAQKNSAGNYSFSTPENPFTREGFTFVGWSLNKNGNGDAGSDACKQNINNESNYIPGVELLVSGSKEYYAIWIDDDGYKDNKAYFFVRTQKGETAIQVEPAAYGSSSYYPQKNGGADYNNEKSQGKLKTLVAVNNNFANVAANLAESPSEDDLSSFLPTDLYNKETDKVLWYVIKNQGGKWHVDGAVVPKDQFQVSYNANGGTSTSDSLPETKFYLPGKTVQVVFAPQPTREGYTFLGWDTNSNASSPKYKQGDSRQNTFKMPSEDVTLYAIWGLKTNLSVDIRYVVYNPNNNTADYYSKVEALEERRVYGSYMSRYNVPDLSLDGYNKHGILNANDPDSYSGFIKENMSTIYVTYEPRKDLEYTVNYLEQGTNTKLLEAKQVNNQVFGTEITETAAPIEGYEIVGSDHVTIRIAEEGNIINFYYTKRADLSYTVQYLEWGTDKELYEAKTQGGQTFNTPVTEEAITIEGYNITGESTKTITIGAGENLIKFYYNKRTDLEYTVNYINQDTGLNIDTKTINGKTLGERVTEYAITIDGYEHVKTDSSVKTITIKVSGNKIDFYYTKRVDLSYTVNYLEEGTGRVLKQSKTKNGQIYQSEVTETAPGITGYNRIGEESQTIRIGTGGNIINFYYTKKTDLNYTVRYLEENTNKELAKSKEVLNQTFGSEVKETAIDIDGYNKVLPSDKSIIIAESGNVITFFYTKRNDIGYTVKYLEKDTDKPVAEPKVAKNKTFGEKVTENAIDVPGYNKVEPISSSIELGSGENVIVFYYTKKTDLSYTVHYVDAESGEPLSDSKTKGGQTYKAEVTEEAIDIPGYTLVGDKAQTITIEAEKNEIYFRYVKRNDLSYTVNYLEQGTDIKLMASKTVQNKTFGDKVTEYPENITGYAKVDISGKDLTISGDEEMNVINFYYTKRTDLKYTVQYREQGTELEVADEMVVKDQTFGDVIKVQAIDVPGYNQVEPVEVTHTINAGNNLIVFYYTKRTDMSYTVNYLEEGTDTPLLDAKIMGGLTLGTQHTENAEPVPGYRVVGPSQQIITLVGEEDKNVINFYYTKRTDIEYKVRYLEEGTEVEVAPPKTETGKTFGENVTEEAVNVKGYSVSGDSSQSLVLNAEDNVITFYYNKLANLSYTVHYLEKGSDLPIASPKTVEEQVYNSQVEETAIDINGYNKLDPITQTITIDVSDNVITFYYVKRTDLGYTVNYLEWGTEPAVAVADADVIESGIEFGSQITKTAKDINGYVKVEPTQTTITIGTGENVINFYYTKRDDLKYTVNYLEQGTNQVLAGVKTVDGLVYGTEVTENAVDIAGYNKVEPTVATIVIGTESNVINFYYTKRTDLSYTVHYIDRETQVPVRSDKVVENQIFGTEVKEEAVEIDGYNKVAPFEGSVKITEGANEITFLYTKRTDISYVVNYLDIETNEAILDQKGVNNGTFGQTVTEEAIDVEGYVHEGDTKATIVLKSSDNVINFYYSRRADLSYSVMYLEQGTDNEVAETKTQDGQIWKSNVTEKAIDIDGYNPVEPVTQTIEIKLSGNIIKFYYTKKNDLHYTVNYLEKGTDKPVANSVTVGDQVFGDKVSVSAIDVPGYKKENPINKSITIQSDDEKNIINFYYTKRTDLSYTVNYLEAGTNNVIVPAKTVGNKTLYEEVTETAKDIDGYIKPAEDTQTFIIQAEGNVITFYYTKRADLQYVVNYLEQGTETKVADSKTLQDQAFGKEITENAISINGYDQVAPTSATITITTDKSKNVINFYYTKRTDLSYTVNYVEEITNKVLHAPKVVDKQTYGTEVVENAIDIDGYNKMAPDQKQLTIAVEGNEITFYYTKRNDISYVVNYLDVDTNEPVAPQSGKNNQVFESSITEEAIDIAGYNKLEPTTAKITLGTGKNEINFYYSKKTDLQYTVNYLEQDTNKVLADAKTVKDQTYLAEVTEEAINIDGYKLVGEASQKLTINVNGNEINFYYAKRSDLSYTVNYLEKGTNKALIDSETVENQIFGSEVTREAVDIKGYDQEMPDSSTIVIGTGENVINFYYSKRADLSYTVKYLEKDTNKQLYSPKTVQNQVYLSRVTETAVGIDGYKPEASSTKTITIGTESNIITFYYTKRADLSYTVNYLEQGTDIVLKEAKVENNQIFQTEVTENAVDIDGYNPVEPSVQSLIIGTNDNAITFYYTKRTDISYTVDYLEESTGKKLSETKLVSGRTFKEEVTEEAITIDGYNKLTPYSHTISLASSGNAIVFYYTKRTDIGYVVNYLDKETNAPIETQKGVNGLTFEAEVTETAIDIDGYVKEEPVSLTKTLKAEGNVFDFYYSKRTDLAYTVKYLEQGTDEALKPEKTVSKQKYLENVTETAAVIEGYNVVEPSEQSIVISTGTNEIVFYYTKRADLSYTVNYLEQGTDKVLHEAKTADHQTYKAEVLETAINIDGYSKVAPTSETIVIGVGKNEITFYYTKRTDLSYTVNYLEKGTDAELSAAKNIDGQTFGAKVTETAIDIAGYSKLEPVSSTIEIKTSGNVINFYYVKRTDLSYTVNYLEKGTNAVLADPKTVDGQTFETEVTEHAVSIDGYNKEDPATQTITIKADENVINFYYTKRTDLIYTVNYLEAGTDNVLSAPKVKEGQMFNSEVSETAIDIDGYTKVEPISQKITIGTGENVITFYYMKRSDITYTVDYLEEGTNKSLAKTKTVSNKTFKEEVTEEAIDITGYNKMAPYKVTIELASSDNKIIFYYTKRDDISYVVNYLDKETNEPVATQKGVNNQIFEDEITEEAIDVDGYVKEEPSSVKITLQESGNEITFYYTKRNDYSYTVNYLEQGSNNILSAAKTVPNQTFKSEVTEEAIDINGYDKVLPVSQKLTIGTGENEITFYYTKRADLSYTVNYLELDTNVALTEPKNVDSQVFGTVVEESAVNIDGYDKVNPTSAKLTIGTEGNVINFFYTKRTDLTYTVKYLEKGTEKVLEKDKKVDSCIFDAEITEEAISITGYNKLEPSKQTINIKTSNNVITFYYSKKNDLTYTVNYLEQGTDKVLADAKIQDGQTFEAEVTETAITINGYVKAEPSTQTITIREDGNVINFYYTKRADLNYTVNYLELETNDVLSGTKTVRNQTFESVAEETAIDIDGYVKVAPTSQKITIGTGENVIDFYYTKRTDITYTVDYLEEGTGIKLSDTKNVTGKTFQEEITEEAIDIIGYNKMAPYTSTIKLASDKNEIVFYYTKRNDISYVVNYLEKGTEKPIASQKGVNNRTFDEKITENAIDIDGYVKEEPLTKTISLQESGNVIDFYYTKRADLDYTVNYLEQGTNEVLQPAKTVQNKVFEEKIIEEAVPIEGYLILAPTSQTITIGTGSNIINFYYTKRTDLTYTVNYLEENTNKVLSEAKTVKDQVMKDEVTEHAITINGYNKVEPSSATITIAPNGNVIDFYYTKRTDLSYTVNYLEEGTNEVIAPQKNVLNQVFEAEAEEDAIDIIGYDKVDPTSKSIIIGTDDNVINFYYTRHNYKVVYEYTGNVPENAPSVPSEEDVRFKDEVTLADNPEVPGYVFNGWVVPEEAELVEGGKKFNMPAQDLVIQGSFTEKEDIEIQYRVAEESAGMGSVSRTEEMVAPATGKPSGSTANAADGYKFVKWTDANGETVSTSKEFIPQKTEGQYVSATYYAHFSIRGDLSYEVHYFYDGTEANDERTIENAATFGETIPYTSTSPKTYRNKNYVLDRVDGADKKVTTDGSNVVNVYYDLDEIGENNPKQPDGIADKYQITFTYQSAAHGSVSGDLIEVVTRERNADGTMSTTNPAYPKGSVTTSGEYRYYINNWTSGNNTYRNLDEIRNTGFTVDTEFTVTWSYRGSSPSGGGNSNTTPGRGNGGDTGNGPGSTTTINPSEVPMANLPNDNTTGENILIDDGEVPLAALPKTGNQTGMNGVFAMLSGILLAAYLTISKKKDEES